MMGYRFILIKPLITSPMAIISKSRSLLGGTILFAYVVTFFLSPWVHHHPGEEHPDVQGKFRHFHSPSDALCVYEVRDSLPALASPINISLLEYHDDVQQACAMVHLLVSGFSFLTTQQHLFRTISPPSKLTLQVDGWESPITPPRLFLSGYKAHRKDFPAYPPQAYEILNCADLSPPTA
jgi:hypothetical protein